MKGRYKGLSLLPVELERDKDLLLSFKLDTHLSSYGTADGYSPENYIERLKNRLIEYPQGQMLLYSGKKVLGHLGFYPDRDAKEWQGYIHMVYVVPDARGQGLGKYLLAKAIDHFREQGIESVALKVGITNERAKALYTSMGFKAVEETKLSDACRQLLMIRNAKEITNGLK